MTLVGNAPLYLPRMDTDIARTGLASGMAMPQPATPPQLFGATDRELHMRWV
jgi:hypothetical protein